MILFSVTNVKRKARFLLKLLIVFLLILGLSPYVYHSTSTWQEQEEVPGGEAEIRQEEVEATRPNTVEDEKQLTSHWQEIAYQLSI